MPGSGLQQRVDVVRRFNRFFTRQIGVLREHLLKSPFSLAEARVLYELAHHDDTTARQLGAELGLDAGYLSRMLRGFQKRGIVQAQRSKTDGRQTLLSLTARGRTAFAKLNRDSSIDVSGMLRRLPDDVQGRLIGAMQTIEGLLSCILRSHRAADMEWVVRRHGELYAQEYGWNKDFEALVAEIVAKFVRDFDRKRERCWIAEKDGVNVGCVFLVQKTRTVAQLRLLLVDPTARGLGIGARLVDECTRFARQVGYRKIVLWTNSVLHAARRLYEQAGYKLTESEHHHSFGHDLVGQTWELTL